MNSNELLVRGFLSHQPTLLHRRLDEGGKQRMWRKWPRLQLRMELHADEPGVVLVFDHFGQEAVGRHAAEAHAVLFEAAFVAGIDFVAMAVALGNLDYAVIDIGDPAAALKDRRVGGEPHGAS